MTDITKPTVICSNDVLKWPQVHWAAVRTALPEAGWRTRTPHQADVIAAGIPVRCVQPEEGQTSSNWPVRRAHCFLIGGPKCVLFDRQDQMQRFSVPPGCFLVLITSDVDGGPSLLQLPTLFLPSFYIGSLWEPSSFLYVSFSSHPNSRAGLNCKSLCFTVSFIVIKDGSPVYQSLKSITWCLRGIY